MRNAVLLLLSIVAFPAVAQSGVNGLSYPAASAPATLRSCDCTSYPFRPNPPCYGSCVAKLASTSNPDLASVKGLDPGVAVSIKVLAANPKKEKIDFTQVKGKSDLEKAADKSFRGNELRFEPSRQMQLTR
jgi:hypothetical protein